MKLSSIPKGYKLVGVMAAVVLLIVLAVSIGGGCAGNRIVGYSAVFVPKGEGPDLTPSLFPGSPPGNVRHYRLRADGLIERKWGANWTKAP